MNHIVFVALLACACSSTSVNPGAGGQAGFAGAAGFDGLGGFAAAGQAGSGGVAGAGGASATGGAAGVSGGGQAGSVGDCGTAVSAALPNSVTLASFLSQDVTGPVCAKCAQSPCGSCDATWGTPAIAGTTAYVPTTVSCSVPGKYGTCGSEVNCTLVLSGSGTTTIELSNGHISTVSAALSGTAAGCPYAKDADAAVALAGAIKNALTNTTVACGQGAAQ